MTTLIDTLSAFGLQLEESIDGVWVRVRGRRCAFYIVEAAGGSGYFTWCDAPTDRTVEVYTDCAAAVRAGLRRADQRQPQLPDGLDATTTGSEPAEWS